MDFLSEVPKAHDYSCSPQFMSSDTRANARAIGILEVAKSRLGEQTIFPG